MDEHGRKSCPKSKARGQHVGRRLLWTSGKYWVAKDKKWTRGKYWVAEDKKSAGNNFPDETPKISGVVSRTGKDRPQIGLFRSSNPHHRTRQDIICSSGYPMKRMLAPRVSTRHPPTTSRGSGKTAWPANMTILWIYLVLIITWNMPLLVESQHRVDTPLFEEKMEAAEAELMYMLQGGDYAKDTFFPERQYQDIDTYVYHFPDAADYSIGIIVDPCKGNTYDCCHRLYGSPEYPKDTHPDESPYRVVDKYLFADEAEILSNTVIVDQEGRTVPKANSRFADDEIVIDDNCTAEDVPDSSCVGFRKRMQRSSKVPPCTDNNQTVNAETSCQDLTGGTAEFCLAVAYSQTAISFSCGGDHAEDPHCGTFLELHVAQANPYVGVEEVISEVRIRTSNVSGYTTTTIPTRWTTDGSKVICAYEHASLLVGTMVLITEGAPVCCCPGAFSLKDRLGSFICPIHGSLEGPYAPPLRTVSQELAFEEDLSTYPSCPALEENKDLMMVSGYSADWDRFFTREAESVESIDDASGYTSSDLAGHYDAVCGYFPSCGAASTAGSCGGDDGSFTFAGRVGKIISVPDDPENEQYGVTFNDGRTTYFFNQEHMRIEHDYNFEVWWVQRTLYNFRVQARKPFTVTSPTCSFDSTNGQYFPFAILDEGGEFVD